MSAEAILELVNTAEQIDPADIGLQAGSYTALEAVDIRAIEQQVRLLAVAQALLQVINTNVSGLVARDIYQQYDLLDGSGTILTNNDWRQPVSGNYATAAANLKAANELVYTTGFNSHYNRKIIIFFGEEVVNVGNFRGVNPVTSNALILKRGNVKLIDIIDHQSLSTRNPPFQLWRTPIMYKAADEANLIYVPDSRLAAGANKFDTIKLLACVVETLGSSQTG
jgi:hypothetical protein